MEDLSQYGRQSIDEEDVRAVVEALRSGWLTTGPAVTRFEAGLSAATGAPFAVSCASGTSALALAYAALGVGPGARVMVPAVTFAATATAALHLGAEVGLVDVDPRTGLMDLGALEIALTRSPGAQLVVPVHYAGRPVDMAAVAAIACRHDCLVVEDACHALGATDASGPIGSAHLSDAVVFSFHPVKSITTGEGGAILTRDGDLADRMASLRSHGIVRDPERFVQPDLAFEVASGGRRRPNPWYHEVQELGWNYRLSDIHAALGYAQLQRLDALVARRATLVRRYEQALLGHPLVRTLPSASVGRSAHHLFVVAVDFARADRSRGAVMRELAVRGIGTQVHYIPLHLQPLLRWATGSGPGDFPGAEEFYARALTLPLHPGMEDADVDRVVEALDESLSVRRHRPRMRPLALNRGSMLPALLGRREPALCSPTRDLPAVIPTNANEEDARWTLFGSVSGGSDRTTPAS